MDQPEILSPLHDVHEKANAEFQLYDQLEIVSTFGDPPAEYAAIRNAAALMDMPQRGVLELAGRDRLSFLNNLLTNQTWDKSHKADMAAGAGVYAFFLNLKGRVVCDMNVLARGEKTLIHMEARLIEPIRMAFAKYLFAEKVVLVSRVSELHTFALHGPGAAAVLKEAGVDVASLTLLASMDGKMFGFDVVLYREDICGVPGYQLIMPIAASRAIWANLLATFSARSFPLSRVPAGEGRGGGLPSSEEFGDPTRHHPNPPPAYRERGKSAVRRLTPIGWAAFNTARIEAGRALFGIDFEGVPVSTAYPGKRERDSEQPETNVPGILPAETGLFAQAVSITKGCYLGQEIVARMHARQQVARRIVGLKVDGDFLPLAGTPVMDDASNAVGVITSSTPSPALGGAAIGLATVKKSHMNAGAVVKVAAEGAVRKATVVELPFVPAAEPNWSTT